MRPGRRHQRRRQDHGAAVESDQRAAATRCCTRATPRAAAARRPRRGRRERAAALDPKLDTLVSYSLYAVIPSPVDDSVWGVRERYPGYLVRAAARQQSAADVQDRDLQGAGAGLRSARRRHRQQRRRLDGAGRQQPPGELRRPQVQGPERARARSTAASAGRLDALSDDRSEAEGHGHPGRLPLLQLGGPAQHRWGSARTRRSPPARTPTRCSCSNPQTRRVDRRCACRIRSASTRAAWTAASTIRTPAGRAAALYANYGTHFVWHIEGGKGTKGKVVKFQMRPDPLAR